MANFTTVQYLTNENLQILLIKTAGEQHIFTQLFSSISELCFLGNTSGIFQRLIDQAWRPSVAFYYNELRQKSLHAKQWKVDMKVDMKSVATVLD